jgi:hypothetical protein
MYNPLALNNLASRVCFLWLLFSFYSPFILKAISIAITIINICPRLLKNIGKNAINNINKNSILFFPF